jgi:eukaryotic-like serine/threonine-protein kinase
MMNGTHNPIFYFDEFEVDVRARELYRNGIKIKVYGQPFEILVALLERPGVVVTREELRKRLWPQNTFVDFERVLNTSVMRLRNALSDSAGSPRYIETLQRVGYRFISQVRSGEAAAPREPVVIDLPAPKEASNGVEGLLEFSRETELRSSNGMRSEGIPWEGVAAHRVLRAVLLGAMAMVAVVFGGVSLGQWRQGRKPQTTMSASPGASATSKQRPAIAILGFKNLSGREDEAWLSTAFSEMLNTEMGAGETLRVIPTQDVAAMKASRSLPDTEKYAQELLQKVRLASGADAIVLGSYTALGKDSGGQVRLDVQVQDTGSGEVRARLSATGTEEKLFPMVARLGAQLRTKLGVAALADESTVSLSASLPENPEAARLYSEGLVQLRSFHAREARELLSKTTHIEPKFAIGHSALSAALMVMGYDDQARAEAKTAVDLSSDLNREERLVVEERYREQMKDWEKAAQIAEALHTFFPDRVDYGIWAARMQTLAGRPAEALITLHALEQLPPPAASDPLIPMTEAEALKEVGNSSAALESIAKAEEKCQAIQAVALEPNLMLEKGNILAGTGDLRGAATAYEQAEQLFGAMSDPNGAARALTHRAAISAKQERYEESRRLYDRAMGVFRSSGNMTAVAEILEDMAGVLQKKGDTQGAEAAREELVSLNLSGNVRLAASRQRVLP